LGVPEAAVANASPLIFLARAGHLDLLTLTGDHVVVPVAVESEIRRRGPDDVTVRALDASPWLETVETPLIPAVIQA
jgi:hypothetical protein